MSREPMEAPRRSPGTTYAVVTALAIVLATVAWMDANILVSDFIGTNQHRSHRQALVMAFFQAPLVGLLVIILAGASGIAVTGASAAIVHRRAGCVPLWTLPIITFLSLGAIFLQARFSDAYLLPLSSDGGPAMLASSRLLPLAKLYLCLLAATWVARWLTRPRRLPSVTEVF